MLHFTTSDLVLHCLPMSHKKDTRLKWINPFHSGYGYTGILANSEDPYEMPHKAAYHQGLHCLLFKIKKISGTEIHHLIKKN